MSTDLASIVAEMYSLNPEQVQVYMLLNDLVHAALEQYDAGFAVDVEQRMADIAKQIAP